MQHNTIENETEALRQLVIAARKDAKVEPEAEACLNRLNTLYKKHPDLFTPEDVRFVNVLRGQLGSRLESALPGGPYARIAKPKGVKLDHCWRARLRSTSGSPRRVQPARRRPSSRWSARSVRRVAASRREMCWSNSSQAINDESHGRTRIRKNSNL